MADSWLIDGNCEVCRRKKYCKTECKKTQSESEKKYL